MKYSVGALLIVIIVFIVMQFNKNNSSQKEDLPMQHLPDDTAEEIVKLLNCDYEVLENTKSLSAVMDKYKEFLAKGQKDGFTPLIVVPSEQTLEMFEMNFEDSTFDSYRVETLKNAESIDVVKLLEARLADSMPIEDDEDYDIYGEYVKSTPTNEFESLIDYNTKKPYAKICIFMIPTVNPWELAAWVPMGGFNECPLPEEQVAVFKHWYNEYDAIPAVVHGDIWELYVQNPVKTEADAKKLSLDEFAFCSDIVWQGVESINALAGTLVDSSVWYFWWD